MHQIRFLINKPKGGGWYGGTPLSRLRLLIIPRRWDCERCGRTFWCREPQSIMYDAIHCPQCEREWIDEYNEYCHMESEREWEM
jgi:hypothetical protein